MTSFEDLFGPHRIMAVLRGMPLEQTLVAAHLAWDLGIELLEVPIGAPDQVAALEAVVEAGAVRGKLVGAGTILTPDHVHAAAGAGARYTVAPGFDPAVLATSLHAGLPHLPGVATPTEVQHAQAGGCRWVKVFPAATLGPGWFRALRGPFPRMNYVATGGITTAAASDYLAAGARIVALGSAVTDPRQHNGLARLIEDLAGSTTPTKLDE